MTFGRTMIASCLLSLLIAACGDSSSDDSTDDQLGGTSDDENDASGIAHAGGGGADASTGSAGDARASDAASDRGAGGSGGAAGHAGGSGAGGSGVGGSAGSAGAAGRGGAGGSAGAGGHAGAAGASGSAGAGGTGGSSGTGGGAGASGGGGSSGAGGSGGSGGSSGTGGAAGAGGASGGGGSSGSGGSAGAGGAGGSAGCGTEDWSTYGHDAQRTSASAGCANGSAPTTRWRYAPTGTANAVFHAVATTDAAFLQWSQPNSNYLGTTTIDRVNADGSHVWTWDNGRDSNLGNWGCLAFGNVVVNDDGFEYLDMAGGSHLHGSGVDWWGQTAPDGDRVYVIQNSRVDGPGVFLAAYDASMSQVWIANSSDACRIGLTDVNNAIAADDGKVFYAAHYATPSGVSSPLTSGVYAFDSASGTTSWSVPTTPSSAISAGGGNVYLFENGGTLTARRQSDGGVVWTQTVTGPGMQAPVLADGLVIVANYTAIYTYAAADGTPGWTGNVSGAYAATNTITFSGACGGGENDQPGERSYYAAVAGTTLAAALGTNTLVVTQSVYSAPMLYILSLTNGSILWNGTVDQAVGALRNPIVVGDTIYVMDSGSSTTKPGLLSLH